MSRIKVCAKVRQSFKEEIGENLRIESNEISISSSPLRHSSSEPRHGSRQGHGHGKFQFEAVYGKGIKGEDIFDERIQSFLDAFLDYGYNITYLVFGESASGQVETFFGEETKGLLKGKKDVGIVPCLVDDLLEKFFKICNTSAERQAQELGSGASVNNRVKQKHFLKLAVIEIHEEKVKDLLFLGNQEQISDRGLPCIEEDELDGISFANVTTLEIRQASDCNSLIQDAFARSTWSRSSKYDNKEIDSSTFLIQFELARAFQGFSDSHKSWFRIIKLPGTEMLVENAAELYSSRHPGTIKSMQSFGNIIKELSGRTTTTTTFKVADYSESVLTKFLSDSLGGNSITSCLLTLKPIQTPAASATLSFGEKLQKIKNYPIENTPYSKNLLRRYRWVMRHLQESSIQEKRLDNALITELKEKVSSLKDKLLALEKEKEELKEEKLIAETNLLDFERKFSELHSSRTELSSRMVLSEQEKLKMSKAVIDLQLECNRISQEAEKQVYELKTKNAGFQEKISDLERHLAFEKRSRQDLKEQFTRTEQDYRDITEEYINLKRNYVSLTEAHDEQLRRNEKLRLEIAAAIESRNYALESKDHRELQRIEELTTQLRSIASRLSTGSQKDKSQPAVCH